MQLMPLSSVKSNPSNPRFIRDENFKKLVQSLKEFPEMMEARPIVVNKDMVILGGNMRYKAAQAAGYSEIAVKVVDWSEDKQKEFIIKDNVSGGEWDWDILANEWDQEELEEWGLDTKQNWESPEVEEDEAPELDETSKPESKLGEVYQLGRHRLLCGDATSTDDLMKLMQEEKAEMVFTDPPYNIDYQGSANNRRDKILNDKMSSKQFYEFLKSCIANSLQVTTGAHYWCMSSKELGTLKQAFEDAGGHWQSYIIWVKNKFNLSGSDYQPVYEPILYGWKKDTDHYWGGWRNKHTSWGDVSDKQATYNDQTDITTIKVGGVVLELVGRISGRITKGKVNESIWKYNRPLKSEQHPTMKPIELCAEAINNSSNFNGIVLDLFLGSGSTLIASEQLNRTCYGMELDPKYTDVIRKRYHKFVSGNEEGWQEATAAI